MDLIKKILHLASFINDSPASCRQLIISTELTRIQAELNTNDDHPEIWLRYATLHQEQTTSTETNYAAEYARCKTYITKSLKAYPPTAPTKPSDLIEDQHQRIMTRCLSKALAQHLESIHNHASFSADEILTAAFQRYRIIIAKEALHFFEIKALITRYNTLIKAEGDRDKPAKRATEAACRTAQELDFIENKLGIKKRDKLNLDAFKLEGTACFWEYIKESYGLSQEQYNLFILNEGEKPTFPRSIPLNYQTFFNDVLNHLQQSILYAERFIEGIRLNTERYSSEPIDPSASECATLNTLRLTVNNYKDELTNIEAYEKQIYSYQDITRLELRKKALKTLEIYINQENRITPLMRQIVTQLVREIKSHKPHWRELPLLDKILDIFTLGAHALIRYSTFQMRDVENRLTRDSEITTDTKKLDHVL